MRTKPLLILLFFSLLLSFGCKEDLQLRETQGFEWNDDKGYWEMNPNIGYFHGFRELVDFSLDLNQDGLEDIQFDCIQNGAPSGWTLTDYKVHLLHDGVQLQGNTFVDTIVTWADKKDSSEVICYYTAEAWQLADRDLDSLVEKTVITYDQLGKSYKIGDWTPASDLSQQSPLIIRYRSYDLTDYGETCYETSAFRGIWSPFSGDGFVHFALEEDTRTTYGFFYLDFRDGLIQIQLLGLWP